MRVGAYPGTFDPPTVAHVAIAEAARRQGGLDRLELVICESPLGKKDARVAPLEHRLELLAALCRSRPWLGIAVNDSELICDIAAGYDAVVMGADKWAQVVDPAWYGGSESRRDAAVARLPQVLLAPRGADVPVDLPPGAVLLDLEADHASVSSTAVRGGRVEWLAPEAAPRWTPAGGAGPA
ncbi:MAG TPA: adenylyltransferase/cytidyltransferase family protein [Acidimicrobiales bacterium]|nr:adenylyltransferase/cytidyltransferase family protein [Acidimicrobiales bacterium]